MPTTEMSTNKRAIVGFIDRCLNKGDVDAIELFARADYIDHTPLPGQPATLEAKITTLHAAISDLRITIDELTEEGDTVVFRLRFAGRHTGELLGLPATGRAFDVLGIDIVRFQDGLMAEHWGLIDAGALLSQLQA